MVKDTLKKITGKNGIWKILSTFLAFTAILLTAMIYFASSQKAVDARQDIAILQKVETTQYWRDIDKIFEQLNRIETKIDKGENK